MTSWTVFGFLYRFRALWPGYHIEKRRVHLGCYNTLNGSNLARQESHHVRIKDKTERHNNRRDTIALKAKLEGPDWCTSQEVVVDTRYNHYLHCTCYHTPRVCPPQLPRSILEIVNQKTGYSWDTPGLHKTTLRNPLSTSPTWKSATRPQNPSTSRKNKSSGPRAPFTPLSIPSGQRCR